ncbi:MAG: GGDEF domain-containing protein [Vitreoscilla sp.]|nr:GGDEF domain-containing protein [Vitreoscilla sp.]
MQSQTPCAAVDPSLSPQSSVIEDIDACVVLFEAISSPNPARCLRLAAEAIGIAAAQDRPDAEMKLRYFTGFAHNLVSEFSASLEMMESAKQLANQLDDQAWEGRILKGLGVLHTNVGEYATAIELLETALSIRRAQGDISGVAATLNNLAHAFICLSSFDEKAEELLQEAHSLCLSVGNHGLASITNMNLAEVTLARAEHLAQAQAPQSVEVAAAAATRAGKAVLQADSQKNLQIGVVARLILAQAQVLAGDAVAASQTLTWVQEHLVETSSPIIELDFQIAMCRWLRLKDQTTLAVANLVLAKQRLGDAVQGNKRLRLLQELVSAQEAISDHRSALATFREMHTYTLQQRDIATERRALLLNARMALDRARQSAELERLRADRLEQRNTILTHEANADALTGLPNRRALEQALASLLADPSAHFSCAIADLDHFKRINDSWSHLVGDEVLRRIGALLHAGLRPGDVVARFGGEEFVILLPGTSLVEATAVTERVRQAIEAAPWSDLQPGLTVTISIGIAQAEQADGFDTLLARADTQLYAAKSLGRNRVCATPPSDERRRRSAPPKQP